MDERSSEFNRNIDSQDRRFDAGIAERRSEFDQEIGFRGRELDERGSEFTHALQAQESRDQGTFNLLNREQDRQDKITDNLLGTDSSNVHINGVQSGSAYVANAQVDHRQAGGSISHDVSVSQQQLASAQVQRANKEYALSAAATTRVGYNPLSNHTANNLRRAAGLKELPYTNFKTSGERGEGTSVTLNEGGSFVVSGDPTRALINQKREAPTFIGGDGVSRTKENAALLSRDPITEAALFQGRERPHSAT